MDQRDMHDIPMDLGEAIHMIARLRAEVERRPRLTVISIRQLDRPYHADTLQIVPRDELVTITLETDQHAFLFTAVASGQGHLTEIQTKG